MGRCGDLIAAVYAGPRSGRAVLVRDLAEVTVLGFWEVNLLSWFLNYFSGNPCPSSHHCVDGSCISWSKTCTQTAFCGDETNSPSVCGKSGIALHISQKKPNLNALVCIYWDLPKHHSCDENELFCFVMYNAYKNTLPDSLCGNIFSKRDNCYSLRGHDKATNVSFKELKKRLTARDYFKH